MDFPVYRKLPYQGKVSYKIYFSVNYVVLQTLRREVMKLRYSNFTCHKSRVAPLNTQNLPINELLGATLIANLLCFTIETYSMLIYIAEFFT